MKFLQFNQLILLLLAALIASALLRASASWAEEVLPNVAIDRIELTGVTVVEQALIEEALEFGVGAPLERKSLVRTAENIQQLYIDRGYEQVSVVTELVTDQSSGRVEAILRFNIVEGHPTRIASVEIVSESLKDERIKELLLEESKLARGEILMRENLKASRRNLQDVLASEEYVGARVEEPELHAVSSAEFSKEFGLEAGRWVHIRIPVELGDRVSFGFRGNEVFSRARLITIVDEQRLIGFGNDYVKSIQERIEREYRELGYASVKVTPYTFAPSGAIAGISSQDAPKRHVSYEIDEGPRFRIEQVIIEGNVAFSSEELREVFFRQASRQVQRRIYVEEGVEKAAELVSEWMKSRGYLGSRLVGINRKLNEQASGYLLTLYFYEGEQTRVQDIKLSGFRILEEPEVLKMLGVKSDEPLNLFAFSEGLEKLKDHYHSRGYLDFQITNENSESVVQYFYDNRLAEIEIKVNEGIRYRISRIDIEGITKTREVVVRRELTFDQGDFVDEKKQSESEANLRRLGLFSTVRIQYTPDAKDPAAKVAVVSVKEGTPGVYGLGVGYRNDLGPRAFGQVAYGNVWNRNHTVSAELSFNHRFDPTYCDNFSDTPGSPLAAAADRECFFEGRFQLNYLWPWFVFGPTHFAPQVSVERRQYPLLDAETASGSLTWERRIWSGINLTGYFTGSFERVKQFNAVNASDNRHLTIGAITPALQIDLRDNVLAPTSGFFLRGSYEIASPKLWSQSNRSGENETPIPVGYTRLQLRSDFFIPLARSTTLYFSARFGHARNLEPPPDSVQGDDRLNYALPLVKQFALGGVGSLRGYSEQDINEQRTAIFGTLSYANYRAQLDLPLFGQLRFGPFLDAGTLTVDRLPFGHLHTGAGMGLHYQSPVGPVNFDWGFKLNPPPGDKERSQFYFSIGVL